MDTKRVPRSLSKTIMSSLSRAFFLSLAFTLALDTVCAGEGGVSLGGIHLRSAVFSGLCGPAGHLPGEREIIGLSARARRVCRRYGGISGLPPTPDQQRSPSGERYSRSFSLPVARRRFLRGAGKKPLSGPATASRFHGAASIALPQTGNRDSRNRLAESAPRTRRPQPDMAVGVGDDARVTAGRRAA